MLLPVSAAIALQEDNQEIRMSFRQKLESTPQIQVVETYIPIAESDIPTVLRDIDSISVKNALVIDGTKNDMLRTFDNHDQAIDGIYKKASGLLNILAENYQLDRMNAVNWEQYQEYLYTYVDDCFAKEDGSYDAIRDDESVLKIFFDIYENTWQNQELINQINASKSGFSQSSVSVSVMDLLPYLPSNTPLINEISEIRIAEQQEQSQLLGNAQLLGNDVQPFGPAISYYFNVNLGRQYAIQYARSRNLLYRLFWYDCTNFVSQILHEGGVPMTSKWWIEKGLLVQDYSTAWVNVNAFCNYLGIDHRTTVLNNFSMYVRVGDVIAYDPSGDYSYDHLGFVTATGTYDWHYNKYGKRQYYRDFMVAQHTNNYHLWVSNPGNGWDDLETDGVWYARVWTR